MQCNLVNGNSYSQMLDIYRMSSYSYSGYMEPDTSGMMAMEMQEPAFVGEELLLQPYNSTIEL